MTHRPSTSKSKVGNLSPSVRRSASHRSRITLFLLRYFRFLTCRPTLSVKPKRLPLSPGLLENHHKRTHIHLLITKQMTRATVQHGPPSNDRKDHSSRLFSEAGQQHYSESDWRRLLCDITKGSMTNARDQQTGPIATGIPPSTTAGSQHHRTCSQRHRAQL